VNELAIICKYTGRFRFGEVLYRRALALVETQPGRDHPMATAIHHNLGGVAHARGDFAAAEPHARRTVQIRAAALSPAHLAVAADRAAWAAVLDGLRRPR
jgi:Flp pilus assembly protein TadD